jgi:hypothetical protein
MRYKNNESQLGQGDGATHLLAKILGVLGLIVGIGELIWAGPLARHLGLEGYEWLIGAYGVREILTGVIILAMKDPLPGIWLRVLGDVLDAATLFWGYTRDPSHFTGVVVAFIAVTPLIIGDLYCAFKLSGESKIPLDRRSTT